MKLMKKISIFVILSLVLCMTLATFVSATDTSEVPETNESIETETEAKASGKLDMNETPESILERASLALQGSVTGMVMVFSVLGLLFGIVSLSKLFLHDIPNKKKEKAIKASAAKKAEAKAEAVSIEPEHTAAPVEPVADDGELVAVITAAVAAMIESGDYKNEFANGFRVVSFKRSAKNAWNRK